MLDVSHAKPERNMLDTRTMSNIRPPTDYDGYLHYMHGVAILCFAAVVLCYTVICFLRCTTALWQIALGAVRHREGGQQVNGGLPFRRIAVRNNRRIRRLRLSTRDK